MELSTFSFDDSFPQQINPAFSRELRQFEDVVSHIECYGPGTDQGPHVRVFSSLHLCSVRIFPLMHKWSDDSVVLQYLTICSHDLFELPTAEIEFIKSIYRIAKNTVCAYFDIVCYETWAEFRHSYSYRSIKNLLLLNLDECERAIVQETLSRFTSIYLIEDQDTGLIKIGRSDNPEQRLRALVKQATLTPRPNNFHILFTWLSWPAREKELHADYADKRVRGEWFSLTQGDVDRIRNISIDDEYISIDDE
jgi:hypothetical protein